MGREVADRLEFGVLGPLEVRRAGEPVRLGGERQRALLALLLVHVNRVVSVDRLVDELFSGQRSESAVNAVRVAVSRLRRTLENGDSGVVRTLPGGYILEVDTERLDAAVFERLVAEGQQRLAEHDPAAAVIPLREALGLWRGPPLADLALLEPVQVEVRRWEELRLVATMERIDADLALGGGGELVGELAALVAANPLQERVRGQLMLALYRAGRQADALTVYRQTSELLRDELGLEPSRRLRKLERSILQQDTTLEPMSRPSPAVATRLPAPPTPFLGRARELAEVTSLLRGEETRLLTLTGAGGSGKTRLALRAAEASRSNYPDGVWFVGFADITDPELIAPTICQALEIGEQFELTPIRRLEGWLAHRRLLLVLDNLEQLANGTSALGELLATCGGLTLLLTSREPLHLGGERQYDVPVLERADAIDLFLARVQAIAPRAKVDPDLAGAICERLDYLPLAVELAAARAKVLSPTEILLRLDERLPLLTHGPRDAPRRQRTLTATIDWSYQLLAQPQERLFARLAVFAGGFTLRAAEVVCEAQLDGLQALVDRGLIVRDDQRFTMLQTIREYALKRLNESGEAKALHSAHARWLTELLQSEGLMPPRWPNRTSLWPLTQERENFTAALEWASTTGAVETLAQLSAMLVGVWITRGQLHEANRWITLALAHQRELPGPLAAQVLSAARSLARHTGDHSSAGALTSEALTLWRELGDVEAIAREMINVGTSAHSVGDLVAARAALNEAITFARNNDLTEALAVALNNLGDLAIREGNLDEGQSLEQEALTVAAAGSVSAGIARINLAHVMMLKGHARDAAAFSREALASGAQQGNLLLVAWAAIELAWALAAQNQLARACRLLGSATRFIEEAGVTNDWMDLASAAAVHEILRDELSPPEAQAMLDEGASTPLEDAAAEELDASVERT